MKASSIFGIENEADNECEEEIENQREDSADYRSEHIYNNENTQKQKRVSVSVSFSKWNSISG